MQATSLLQQGSTIPATPGSLQEYEALLRQRGELREQQQVLRQRRNQLDEQRRAGGDATSVTANITLIDKRMTQIDRDLLRLDEAIGNGAGKVWEAQPGLPAPPPPPSWSGWTSQPDDLRAIVSNAAEEAVAGAFAGGVVSMLALYALYRGFRRFVLKSKPARAVDAAQVNALQNSVDAIAIEVERISESQRFLTKALNDKLQLGAGDAARVGR